MRVRRLEIHGFKSFADQTIVDFPDGMCAVVGPNGCGKSNVVDAVRWVLGEQSAKQLRGQAMDDVIFAGAEARKAAGLAEVSLVFENNGSISHPQFADLSEIMITRRLFRSGDSDYLINKMPCRLKDIQQLLMDTGLGNRAYAIIEQGRVAAFIEAKPEERRLWVEEAAGITRYKSQKKVSERKMQASRENLERLADILHEVETQMARLKRQAKKAQAHQELRTKIKDLDLNIQSHEFERLTQELATVDAEAEAVGASLLLANQRLTGLETDLETMKVQLVQAESEISQAGQRRLEAQGAIQKAENELTMLGQGAENQRRLDERYRGERAELAQRLKDIEAELERARRRAQESAGSLTASRAQLEAASAASREKAQAVRTGEALVEDARSAVVNHMARTSQINNRLSDLERQKGELTRRREQVTQRQANLEKELAELEERHRAAQEELAGLRARQAQAEAAHEEAATRRKDLAAERNRFDSAEKAAVREAERLAARHDAMAASLRSHDWTGSGVREILKAASKGQLPVEIMGLVADHLSVAEGWEAVAEAALEADLQAVVVPDRAAALALAGWSRQRKLGRIKVAVLDELKPLAGSAPAGSEALADKVSFAPGFEALAALAAGVGRAADLDAAGPAWVGLAPGQSLVTDDGQRLERPGLAAMAGGGKGGAGAADMLSRKNQLAHLADQAAEAAEAARLATLERQRAEAGMADLEEELSGLAARRQELERELRAKEQAAFRLGEEAGARRRQLEGLGFDQDEIQAELERSAGEEAKLSAELEGGKSRQEALEHALEEARAQLDRVRDALEEARQAESEARLAAANLESQAGHAKNECRRLEKEAGDARQRLAALEKEITGAQDSLASLTRRREELQSSLGQLYERLDREEAGHRQAKEVLGQAQMRTTDLESALKQARAEQRQVESQSNELALSRKELILSRDHVCEQALERCRVDLTNSHKEFLPTGAFDPETARERLGKLRQRLNNLGPVNMEAIGEHEALAERHEFLTSQRADLEESLADLNRAILKINRTSRDRFTETLTTVNQRLTEIFPVLFGGGHAELQLDEGVDPLEAGLNLMVELPGKKTKNIGALSGGEKAMSAAAVLFALFLIRPAPFCILDEVDAPLDEANVGRFHDLLKELSKRSQIVMITHSRRTMEVMATLYGVTMEEKGVSKILSVDLAQGEAMAA